MVQRARREKNQDNYWKADSIEETSKHQVCLVVICRLGLTRHVSAGARIAMLLAIFDVSRVRLGGPKRPGPVELRLESMTS